MIVGRTASVQRAGIRALDAVLASCLLVVLAPVMAVLAIAIKVDDGGAVFFRARRLGHGGREFPMLKFRKMAMGATGSSLTSAGDHRFTRLGRVLAATKLDELPQLWNVVRGHMSLVGPRPEDPDLVARQEDLFAEVISVRPGITGLAQLAYSREAEVLGTASGEEQIAVYFERILPQKVGLDRLWVENLGLRLYLRVLWWTAVAVILRRSVAVDRRTGDLGLRQPRGPEATVALGRPNTRVTGVLPEVEHARRLG